MIAELQTAIVNKPRRDPVDHDLTAADKMKIKVERHALLLRGAPTAVCASAILGLVTCMVAWAHIDRLVLMSWTSMVIGFALVRMGLWFHFSRRKTSAHALQNFSRLHVIAMGMNGALWGMLGPMFTIHELLGNAYLPFVIAGMTAATVSSAGASWRAVLAFNVPALLPLAATYAFMSAADGLAIGAVVLMYLIATAFLALSTQEMIVRSIRLRSRNANLLRALKNQTKTSSEAEQRFRGLVESSKNITLIFSPQGQVSYASPSIEAALGVPPREIVGMSTKQLVHPDDFQIFKSVGEQSLSQLGEVMPLSHICLKAHDGNFVPLTGRLTNMLYVPGVDGFVFDGGPLDETVGKHTHAAE